MARVQNTFYESYSPMDIDTLRNPVIFVVDMVNGFVKEGALHDEKIHAITPNIQALLEEELCRNVFVADSHPPKTREFLSYPSHCVIGTSESEVLDELKPYIHECIPKNSTNTFTCPAFQSFLNERIDQYDDIVITGCCTDICILQFALCLNAWLNEHNCESKRVIVPIDCIDTFHIEGVHDCESINEFSIRNMEQNGIVIVSRLERRK